MSILHFPWLSAGIAIPLAGSLHVRAARDPDEARARCFVYSGFALVCMLSAWIDFQVGDGPTAGDPWDPARLMSHSLLVVDALNAPLLPLTAGLFLLTSLLTLRTKIRRFSFGWMLIAQSILLATLACPHPWGIIGGLVLTVVPPSVELRARGRPARAFLWHMGLSSVLMAVGWALVEAEGHGRAHSAWAIVPLLLGVVIRAGLVPFHCWMTDLFEHATFGTALLFVTPMAGAYAAVRLVLPVAPDWALRGMSILALVTALYSAGMSLVQRDARRFFCYLFLSHTALVLVGLDLATPIGLTGALLTWLASSVSLAGFGLTLRSVEARAGRLSLLEYHGLYPHMPTLGVFFLLTGLASSGFPGTLGFVGSEILVDGVIAALPQFGVAIVLAGALNGIAVLQAYFRLFTGRVHGASVSLARRPREQVAILALGGLIFLGGFFPQPHIRSRYDAALQLLREREGQAARWTAEHERSQPGLFIGP